MFVNLGNIDGFNTVFTVNEGDGVGQLQRNIEVVEALDDVTGQAVGVRHDFSHTFDVRAFEGHTAGHDQSDIAGAEDNDFFTGHVAFHVDETLCGPGSEDAGRSESRNADGAGGSFAAAHGQDNSLSFKCHIAVFFVNGVNDLRIVVFSFEVEDHCVQFVRNLQIHGHINVTACVFRTG